MKTISRKFHIVAGKYPNLVRTKKKNFSKVRTMIRIKKILPKKASTNLGSTKIIFIDRCSF